MSVALQNFRASSWPIVQCCFAEDDIYVRSQFQPRRSLFAHREERLFASNAFDRRFCCVHDVENPLQFGPALYFGNCSNFARPPLRSDVSVVEVAVPMINRRVRHRRAPRFRQPDTTSSTAPKPDWLRRQTGHVLMRLPQSQQILEFNHPSRHPHWFYRRQPRLDRAAFPVYDRPNPP